MWCARSCNFADVQPTDHVLEVGPGIGTLTCALLQFAGHVTAVEMDHDLPRVLADTLAPWADHFSLLEMDALDLPAQATNRFSSGASPATAEASAAIVPALPNKMVSNLPYAVAATVVLDYFQSFPALESATVMVQKEVADRMYAQPGQQGLWRLHGEARTVRKASGALPRAAPGTLPAASCGKRRVARPG